MGPRYPPQDSQRMRLERARAGSITSPQISKSNGPWSASGRRSGRYPPPWGLPLAWGLLAVSSRSQVTTEPVSVAHQFSAVTGNVPVLGKKNSMVKVVDIRRDGRPVTKGKEGANEVADNKKRKETSTGQHPSTQATRPVMKNEQPSTVGRTEEESINKPMMKAPNDLRVTASSGAEHPALIRKKPVPKDVQTVIVSTETKRWNPGTDSTETPKTGHPSVSCIGAGDPSKKPNMKKKPDTTIAPVNHLVEGKTPAVQKTMEGTKKWERTQSIYLERMEIQSFRRRYQL
ncbi:hypothetical protein EX30DRAFT_371013 [Ascodesmis nigricans]|uniref:Uncharacterized protein n=1 Tax=Ascodesmis nigricans TaxID=341454 RepID=A0A4S2MYF9_9PEZI|nr:hypothetical protein EX30DRAFT_371013 [Ascodesmis nigricans]